MRKQESKLPCQENKFSCQDDKLILQAKRTYQRIREELNALSYAQYICSWDYQTETPTGSAGEHVMQVGYLNSMSLRLSHSEEYVTAVKTLYDNKLGLEKDFQTEIIKVYEDLEKELKVPYQEIADFRILCARAFQDWKIAKSRNDFAIFAPRLKAIIEWENKYIKYLETPTLKGYDVLLNDYEKGFSTKDYDLLFALLKEELVPFVKKILKMPKIKDDFVHLNYDIEKQKEYSKYLIDVMDFDLNYGVIKESEHPFTNNFGTDDVRITCHYYPDLITSSIFSVLHELGHATYERQCNPKYNNTPLSGGTTMAMHEAQSRFYENIVGRSKPFWQTHYQKLQNLFRENLQNVTWEEFYQAVNKVECSLIRTEADELTYPLHIMIRYDLEKALFNQEIKVEDLEKTWNKLYKKYLGINVPNASLGILQDIHWADGSFGYFPTYTLGSAYAAQLYYAMKKDFDVEKAFGEENLQTVNNWLKNKVHQYAASKSPHDILVEATGEPFNPKYYVEYLKEKYTKIYKLKN